MLETINNELGALFYQGGSNRGNVMFMKVEQMEAGCSVYQGMRYSKWQLSQHVTDFSSLEEIVNFVVLLPKNDIDNPKKRGQKWGEFSIASKEWSPKMLEYFEYSKLGIVLPKKEEIDSNDDSVGWV